MKNEEIKVNEILKHKYHRYQLSQMYHIMEGDE